MADTNAIKWLHAQGVEYQVLNYPYEQFGAEAAAQAVARPLEMVCKTLIVKSPGNLYHVVIAPGDQRLQLKKFATVAGVKQAELAPQPEAEKVTGYRVGGIAPFAQRRTLPTFLEETALLLDRIIVNAGRRGVLVELATTDLVNLTNATPADICLTN